MGVRRRPRILRSRRAAWLDTGVHRDAAEAFLGRSWSEVERDAAAYVAAAEALVVRWEWVARSDTLWEVPEPRVGAEAPMRVLPQEPPPEERENARLLGYDGDGRIVAARYFRDHWEGRDGGWQRGVVSVEAAMAGHVLLRFTHERWGFVQHQIKLASLIAAEREDDGRITVMRSWAPDGCSESRFHWEGGRLEHALVDRFERDGRDGFRSRKRLRREYEYDDQGLLRVRWVKEFDRYFADSEGDSGVSWYRRSPRSLRAARKLVNDRLHTLIEAWVARVAPPEPVYGLGIVYSLDAPTLPPALGLGTVAELRAWQARCDDVEELRSYAFNPAEYRHFDPVPAELDEDPALQDAYAQLNQEWDWPKASASPPPHYGAARSACSRPTGRRC
jgi:hypothetical protein